MTDLEKYLTELLVEADKTASAQSLLIERQTNALEQLAIVQSDLETELEVIKMRLDALETSSKDLETNMTSGLALLKQS